MSQKSTVFFNPKFKNIHVNPNFLQQSSKVQVNQSNPIHVNPKFFMAFESSASFKPPLPDEPPVKPPLPPAPTNAIIRNTRRTWVRASSTSRPNVAVPTAEANQLPQQTLIKISKNRLVTAAHLMKCQQKENEIIKNTTNSIIKTKKLQRRSEKPESLYKVDRRNPKKKVISTYSIRRVSPMKWDGLKTGNNMVNISGVLYNSTNTKLVKSSSEKVVVIRGEKFTLDSSGTKLQRDNENGSGLKLSRIDIGGLTYKSISKSGTFERDNSHNIRSHLSLAKTKSISLLARSAMKKSNIICPIYRRIGKCLAYANGRCQKLHDPRYVIVCPKHIKGLCQNEKCLLSHNVNLHKMPVCKYFLQGLCQKHRECLYLHKKLNDDTKLCTEFLKGYCPKADKCNLLHKFLSSENRDKKKFSIVRRKSKRETKKPEKPVEDSETVRYYIDESESAKPTGDNVPIRKKLQSLPSYIPL